MKKNILIVLNMLLSICTYSQQNFYYVNGNKAFWQDDSTSINVIVGNREKYNDIAGLFCNTTSSNPSPQCYNFQ